MGLSWSKPLQALGKGHGSSKVVWLSLPAPTHSHPHGWRRASPAPSLHGCVSGFFSFSAAASGPEEFAAESRLLHRQEGETGRDRDREREMERRKGRNSPSFTPQYPAPSLSHLLCPSGGSLSSEPLRVTETWVPRPGFPEMVPWAIQGVTLSGPLSFGVEMTPAGPYHVPWERLCRKEGCVTHRLNSA